MSERVKICMDCEREFRCPDHWRHCPVCRGRLLTEEEWEELIEDQAADREREAEVFEGVGR